MDQFPRIDLFTSRERRATAILAAAVLAFLVGSWAYLRPAPATPAAAASTAHPSTVRVDLWPVTSSSAYAVTFRPGARAAEGLFWTDDAGRSWRRLRVPAGVLRFSVIPLSAPSDLALMTIGEAGVQQWLSRDGGRAWTVVRGPDGLGRNVQFYPHSSRAVFQQVTPSGLAILVSEDEGESWRPLLKGAVDDPQPLRSGQGAAVGFGGGSAWLMPIGLGTTAPTRLFRSPDDGATWEEVRLPPEPRGIEVPVGFSLPAFASDGRGYIMAWAQGPRTGGGQPPESRGSWVTTTDDAGRTWSPLRRLPSALYFPLDGFADDWWSVDDSRLQLLSSRDFGQSWSAFTAGLPAGLRLGTIGRVTPLVAWNIYEARHADERSHILRTTDGGRHWTEVTFPTS